MTVSTDGGPATLRVPGGPYALTADSDGGPELIGIATDPAARPSIQYQQRRRPAPARARPVNPVTSGPRWRPARQAGRR